MDPPPLFSTLPRPVQVQVAGLGPLLVGAVCGFLLGESESGYWALSFLAAVGGLAGGFEHDGVRAGALRGVVAGALFGAGLLGADAVSADPRLAAVPSPLALIVIVTAAIGAALGAVGASARGRYARRRGLSDPEVPQRTRRYSQRK
jgi:uncharacterized membrane protein (UPF0136 family)